MTKIDITATRAKAKARRKVVRPAGALVKPVQAVEPDTLAQHASAYVAALKATSDLRSMELIGMAEDGRMFLWDTGNVQPVSAFETAVYGHGRFIQGGHYVIDWRGHAVVVHCGAGADGRVSVQFMCSGGYGFYASRKQVEAMLLGLVVPDPILEAQISAKLKRLTEAVTASQQAPHRARGVAR